MAQISSLTQFTNGTSAQAPDINTNLETLRQGHNAHDTRLDTLETETRPVNEGGTGLASYTAGDTIYASATTTLAKLAKGTALQYYRMNSGATAPEWADLNIIAGINYVQNLIGKLDTDTDHDINFYSPNTNYQSHVLVRDASYNVRIISKAGTAEITKRIDATWAAGNDAGGLDDNDTLASGQCLYGFMLCKSTDDSVDFGFTDDVTGASLLTDAAVVAAGFDEISAVPIHYLPPLDASSNIIGHKTYEIEGGGVEVIYNVPIRDVNDTTSNSTSAQLATLTAPANSKVLINFNYDAKTDTRFILITETSQTDTAASASVYTAESDSNHAQGQMLLQCDASSQIRYRVSNAITAGPSLQIFIRGYQLSRRP